MNITVNLKIAALYLVAVGLLCGCAGNKEIERTDKSPDIYERYIQERQKAKSTDIGAEQEFQAIQYGGIDALTAFLEKHPTGKAAILARQSIENINIRDIQQHGIGNRFRIPEILPETVLRKARLVSFTINSGRDLGFDTDALLLEAEYPKDRLCADIRVGYEFIPIEANRGMIWTGRDFSLPSFSSGSVIRFRGNVQFRGCTLIGSDTNPLSFMLLSPTGLVYLTGDGTVISKDGKLVTFKPKPQAAGQPDAKPAVDLSRFDAVGILRTSGIYITDENRHYRIVNESENMSCYAAPTGEAKKVDLNKFVGRKVGLIGKITPDPETGNSIIMFSEITSLE